MMHLKYEHDVTVLEKDLVKVVNSRDNTSMLLYFNEHDVKNFNKANPMDKEKMITLLSDHVDIARQYGQAGVKKLSKCSVEVEYYVNGKAVKNSLAYEVKINNSAARIGLISLQPLSPLHPVLLVAAVYLQEGLHKDKSKKYSRHAISLDKHGLFKQVKPRQRAEIDEVQAKLACVHTK